MTSSTQLTPTVSTSLGTLYPIYLSYKAIKANDLASLETLLMYWVVMGAVGAAEGTIEWVVNWSAHPIISEGCADEPVGQDPVLLRVQDGRHPLAHPAPDPGTDPSLIVQGNGDELSGTGVDLRLPDLHPPVPARPRARH